MNSINDISRLSPEINKTNRKDNKQVVSGEKNISSGGVKETPKDSWNISSEARSILQKDIVNNEVLLNQIKEVHSLSAEKLSELREVINKQHYFSGEKADDIAEKLLDLPNFIK